MKLIPFAALLALPLLIIGCDDSAGTRGRMFSTYMDYERLREPQYSALKRAIEGSTNVTVTDIREKIGGLAEGILHDSGVGKTFLFLDITLNVPDDEAGRRLRREIIETFTKYVLAMKLGFEVHYVSIQFRSPDYYVEDSFVQ